MKLVDKIISLTDDEDYCLALKNSVRSMNTRSDRPIGLRALRPDAGGDSGGGGENDMIGQKITGVKGRQFDIIQEIGRGGFGIVYLARGNDNRDYALKTIVPTTGPEGELSFKREVESAFGLSHQNLLSIIDLAISIRNQVMFCS
jgi:serine/threonine protein kinase